MKIPIYQIKSHAHNFKAKQYFCVLFFFLAVVCKGQHKIDLRDFINNDGIPEYESSILYGKIQSVKETSYIVDDVWGKIKIIKKGKDYDDTHKDFYLEFDKKGTLVEKDVFADEKDNYFEHWKRILLNNKTVEIDYASYTSKSGKEKTIIKYADKKLKTIIESCTYDSTGALTETIKYNYGKHGNYTKYRYGRNDSLIEYAKYDYDRHGNYAEHEYDRNNNFMSYARYDKHGNLLYDSVRDDVFRFYDTAKKLFVTQLFYSLENFGGTDKREIKDLTLSNSKGQVVKKESYSNGKLEIENTYSYNKQGKHTEKSEYDKKYIYTYNAQSLLAAKEIISKVYSDKTDYLHKELYIYTYDKHNNLVEKKSYGINNNDGSIDERLIYRYEYDKKGNWTRLFTLDDDNSYIYMIEREIKYRND